jgi:nucleoside-diphosphate-sugar epimerase
VTILVTGAAGFLGRHLARSLLAEGHHVIGVDSFITSDRIDLLELRIDPRFTFFELDVSREEFVAKLGYDHLDAIYHLACPTGVPNLQPLALEMLETCYLGSKAVLELARLNNAPVLLTSTAEVYGDPEVMPQAETYTGNVDPLGPRKGYEEGKRVAETLFGIYAERFGVRAKIARVFNTYGPGMALSDTRVVPSFIVAALRNRPLIIYGDGSQTRCHTYVDDMVAGLRSLMERGRPGRAYNLGSQTPVSVLELARTIMTLAGSRAGIEYRERPAHDHDRRLPDINRARTELGWQPVVPLGQGLARTIEDFAQRLAATRLFS